MKTRLTFLLILTALAASALAAPLTFDFKDPKKVNNAIFKLDAPLEAINGSADGISGSVTFDPANPGATKGKIVVDAASLQVPNSMMKEHMHGAQWLDVANHKEISFDLKGLSYVKTDGLKTNAQMVYFSGDTVLGVRDVAMPDTNGFKTTADAVGTFTLKGVSKEITVPVTLTYLKDKLAVRSNGQMKGDLLVIRANFAIKRADYGINPKAPADKVADTIDLTLSIAGAAPQN